MFGQVPVSHLCYLYYLRLQESQRKCLVTSEEQSLNFPLKYHGLSNSLPLGSPLQFVAIAYIHLDIPFWELHSSTVALLSGAKITSSSSIWRQSPIPFKSALCWAKKNLFPAIFLPYKLKILTLLVLPHWTYSKTWTKDTNTILGIVLPLPGLVKSHNSQWTYTQLPKGIFHVTPVGCREDNILLHFPLKAQLLRSGEDFSAINVLLTKTNRNGVYLPPSTKIHDMKAMFQVIANIQDQYY